MNMRYSVIGLGKLGASMAAAIAKRGFHVIGVDVDQKAVDLLNNGRPPVQETDLEAMILANRDRIQATTSHKEAILNSDVTFVVVPTPSDEQHAFSLQYAAWAFQKIGLALAEKKTYHNIVLTSTVLPGSTRHGLLPILEQESGKKCGRNFGLCYSPEFIALGSVIRDFLNPDFTLIGEYDDKAGKQLETCYSEIMENNPPCKRMNIENAELTKIALNAFVTTKITFANMIANLCEKIPGGNVDVVTDALGSDCRIGRNYLTGALGYGGPCFPRDNKALSYMAKELGTCAKLSETTDEMNENIVKKMVNLIHEQVPKGSTIAILGLAYKPYSHVIEDSQSVYIAKQLSQTGFRVVAYDPLACKSARTELKDQAIVLNSIYDCLNQADAVLITTPDPVFSSLRTTDFLNNKSSITVIDCWRILSNELADQTGIRYIPIGYSFDDEKNLSNLAALWNPSSKLAA